MTPRGAAPLHLHLLAPLLPVPLLVLLVCLLPTPMTCKLMERYSLSTEGRTVTPACTERLACTVRLPCTAVPAWLRCQCGESIALTHLECLLFVGSHASHSPAAIAIILADGWTAARRISPPLGLCVFVLWQGEEKKDEAGQSSGEWEIGVLQLAGAVIVKG